VHFDLCSVQSQLMGVLPCSRCGARFQRKAHVDAHMGSRRCLLRRSVQRRQSAEAKEELARTNMKRRVRTHIKPLILFLKDNVQRCLSQTHSKRVCFVPFCPGYVAADVFDMSQVLKIAARRAGVFTSRDRCQRSQRVLAACALTTCFLLCGEHRRWARHLCH